MKRKSLLLLLAVVVLLGMTTGVVWALSSTSYQVPANSLQGGGAGGGTARSTSYIMVTSLGGAVQVNNTSPSYAQCNGFLCRVGTFLRSVFLPLIMR